MDDSKLAAMLLLQLPDVGAATYWRLLKTFETAQAAIAQSPTVLQPHLSATAIEQLTDYRQRCWHSELGQKLQRDVDWLQANDISVIANGEDNYPSLLAEIHLPPPLLYLRGNSECLHLPQLAVVGSRKPTAQGCEIAYDFSRYLTRTGFTITSGLALGIDGIAHKAAVDADGTTVAVLGTGIDIVYPRRHASLATDIVQHGGALVSEFPLGTEALAMNFPRRNRIISGLSLGVLVVEAALKSGSLISARFAAQQNREVFAVPGSISSPLSRGCHNLLREGATLVEQAQDIVEQLKGMLSYKYREVIDRLPGKADDKGLSTSSEVMTDILENLDQSELSDQELSVLKNIDGNPKTVDALVMDSGLDVAMIMSSLVVLELMGLVAQTSTGYQRLK